MAAKGAITTPLLASLQAASASIAEVTAPWRVMFLLISEWPYSDPLSFQAECSLVFDRAGVEEIALTVGVAVFNFELPDGLIYFMIVIETIRAA